ncbi:MAG: peptide ABC transporter substrate-binding protein [Clostridia bacterium]|nr:peptide ABC transporter substrate-binding protein [Clostridia bacterium]
MKKFLALLLVAVMALTIAACGPTEDPTEPSNDNNADAPVAADLVSDAFIDPINGWKVYDDLIAEIKAETDYAKRTELMHKAEDILMSNGCVIPLYYYNDIYMEKDYVSGMYANLFGYKFFQKVTLANGADTLRINLASEPDYLDPALNSSVDGACLAVNSFAGLYTYDAEGNTVPDLATGYTVSEPAEDGSVTFTVTLKDGLKWSDGSALTAADFEYSWKRAASEKTASDYGYMFSTFVGYPNELAVTAKDATTLEFSLTAPCAYMEGLMAFPTFFPVPQAAVEAYADWETSPGGWCTEAGFVSNGPFVCTGWEHDVSMTYEKNPNYHDVENVTVDKIEFMLSADDTAIYAAYNAGNVDIIDTVPTDEIQNLLATENKEFKIVDNLGTYYVAFNANSELFAGKTPEEAACMRLAFNILIDRDYICENVGQTGQVAASSYIPLGMADGNGGIFKETAEANSYYDAYAINNDKEATIEKARTYLKAAGFKFGEDGKLSAETPITIEYLTNDGTGHVAAAESMQQDFAEVGITMSIQQVEWNTFLEERKNGNFDIAREGWLADFDDPINMLEMFTTSSGNNDCQYGRYEGWDA